jgi:hypothetical protein
VDATQTPSSSDLSNVVAACASAFVDSQLDLDAAGARSMLAWEVDGLPPTSLVWRHCRFSVGVALAMPLNTSPSLEPLISLRRDGGGRIDLAFRHVTSPPDFEKRV